LGGWLKSGKQEINTRMCGAFGTSLKFERKPAFGYRNGYLSLPKISKKLTCIDQNMRQVYRIANFYRK
jgi:hypothetical protein